MTNFASFIKRNSHRISIGFIVSIFILATPLAKADERTVESFEKWRGQHSADVAAYEAFLKVHGVDDVIPIHQLTRTARDWKKCGNPVGSKPFEVAPQDSWKHMVSTLKLIAELRKRNLLGKTQAVSVYRDASMNLCAGGSDRSSHLNNTAVDIAPDPNRAKDQIQDLCRFWRSEGSKYQMGLGLYRTGAVHIDTGKFRTWGPNGRGASSPCKMKTNKG